jgi:hypothetical protein
MRRGVRPLVCYGAPMVRWMLHRRGWFCLTACAALLGLSASAGCADDGASKPPPHENGPPTSDSDDLVDHSPSGNGLAAPACLGERVDGRLAHGLPYLELTVGLGSDARTGAFLLDWGTTRSTIDLAAFPAPGPLAHGCPLVYLGERCSFDDLDFFGSWGEVTFTTADHSAYDDTATGGLRQAGILGTDFFATAVYSIDFAPGSGAVYRAPGGAFCDDGELATGGFVALSSVGFYSNDFEALKPLAAVVDGGSAGATVPNVPTVPLRIGGVVAQTQLDTGFADERVPHSINVNEAYYSAVASAHPDALVRAPELDLALTTCVSGLSELVDAYRLAPGYRAELETTIPAGGVTGAADDAVVFVKHTPPAARACGGIGTWDVPAAQIGASFFAGRLVSFDPFRGLVWFR